MHALMWLINTVIVFQNRIQIYTWFQPGKHIAFSGFSIVRRPRYDSRTVATLVTKGIWVEGIQNSIILIEGFQLCGIKTNSQTRSCKTLNILLSTMKRRKTNGKHSWAI